MKYWHLIWSNLRRKKLRTFLTVLSILIAFVLFGLRRFFEGIEARLGFTHSGASQFLNASG